MAESRAGYGGREEEVESKELLQGQKLLGWVLILTGLLVLMVLGLAQSLVARYPLPSLECFAAWVPSAWWTSEVKKPYTCRQATIHCGLGIAKTSESPRPDTSS